MTPLAFSLFVVTTVMLANQAVMRIERLWRLRPVFLGLQALNAGTTVGLFAFGIPGFETWPAARYVFSAIFGFRMLWNFHERSTTMWNERREARAAESERQRQLLSESESEEEE